MSDSTKAAIDRAVAAHLEDISVRGGKLKDWSLRFGEEWTESDLDPTREPTTVTVYHGIVSD